MNSVSFKQVGLVISAVCTAGFATNYALGKLYTHLKAPKAENAWVSSKNVNRMIKLVSVVAGIAAGAFAANYMGLISLSNLASGLTSNNSSTLPITVDLAEKNLSETTTKLPVVEKKVADDQIDDYELINSRNFYDLDDDLND